MKTATYAFIICIVKINRNNRTAQQWEGGRCGEKNLSRRRSSGRPEGSEPGGGAARSHVSEGWEGRVQSSGRGGAGRVGGALGEALDEGLRVRT